MYDSSICTTCISFDKSRLHAKKVIYRQFAAELYKLFGFKTMISVTKQ